VLKSPLHQKTGNEFSYHFCFFQDYELDACNKPRPASQPHLYLQDQAAKAIYLPYEGECRLLTKSHTPP